MAHGLIIAGGGLAGVLTALAIAKARPDLDMVLLEAAASLGGNHTWSAFASDLDPAATALVAPLVVHRWDGYAVHFKGLSRTLSTPYLSITAERLDRVARQQLAARVRLDTPVAAVDGTGVTLPDGTRLEADAVIDARGAAQLAGTRLRWQTFLGKEVRLSRPHGLTEPVVMDARVPQFDGYRFVYVLPFDAETLLIEDTYYTERPEIDAAALSGRIEAYAADQGFAIAAVVREEAGALPLLLDASSDTLWREAAAAGAVPVGLRAGLFHPVTGYSLPLAARTAGALAALEGPLTTPRMMATVADLAHRHIARSGFERLLNRLLFLAGAPEDRHLVLKRFYGLPQPLVERFYAGRLTLADRARILSGKPPVPLLAALRVLR